MSHKILVFAALLLLASGAVRPLAAQSLADLSRQEEERRKGVREPAKVLTNKDLVPVPLSSVVAPPPDASATPGDKPAESATDADKGKGDASTEPAKDQAYWSGRMKALQAQLDRDETFSVALQSRINALTTDFVNRDDPAQRAIIAGDRQKATTEHDRLRDAIQKDKKAIADLDEEARRASVPPGWLR